MPMQLLAIVSVPSSARVQCQNPGCGHGVYAAIHVVQDGQDILVLGSRCYRNRYQDEASQTPALAGGAWGHGEQLSDEDRKLLQANTAALVEVFRQRLAQEQLLARQQAEQREEQRRQTQARNAQLVQRQQALQGHPPPSQAQDAPALPPARPSAADARPWPWQHRSNTSVAVLRDPEGQDWVRVQHKDGSQKLAPWPVFDGWDEALPPSCGSPDLEIEAYAVPNIVQAITKLRAMGFSDPVVGVWPLVKPRAQSGASPN